MLAPPPALLRRGPQLHRVDRLRPLHHDALEKVAAQRAIRFAKPLVKRQRIGM